MLFKAGISARGTCAALVLILVSGLTDLVPALALGVASVNLAWSPSASTNLTGYTVYYGVASRTYTNAIAVGNATNTTISGLSDGVIYYFAATAVDDAGLESNYSNEATNCPSGAVSLPPSSPGPQPALTLVVSGKGKISPDLTSQKLTMGRSYAISAVPSPGQMFCGWAGSITSSLQHLSFSMKSNLVLQANFASLNLTESGVGTFLPDLRIAQNLTAGKIYAITAIPGAGQLFTGWTGTIASSAPRITFLLTTNVHLQANFIPNPFLAVQGTYSGLFYEDAAVRPNSAGSFTVSVTARGGYSGNLQLGARRLTLSGQLDFHCQATKVIALAPNHTLTLSLGFGTADQADRVSGTLTDGTWVSSLSGDRAVFNARTHPAPYAGTYTLVLPGSDGDPSVPVGDGYGTVRVSTAGMASFSGTLADGTAVSQSATLSKDGFWPLYVPIYSGQGVLISWLAFTNQTGSDINGLLSWVKPVSSAQYYPAGFTQECQALGSAYVQPARQYGLDLSLTNASLAFSGGNLSADITNSIVVGQFGRLINESTNALTVSFSPLTGTFKGRVSDPATSKSLPFGGAVFQKQNAGYGFLLGPNQSSRVNLLP